MVSRPVASAPTFAEHSGEAAFATPVDPTRLVDKWTRANRLSETDVIYIGKGDNLRERVKLLARFGVGRTAYHAGGEWMWQFLTSI
jgi:hypothetical protein